MKTLKLYFKHRETFIGIATAIAFLVIFFCIWMTAYDGVTGRTSNLKVGLVNNDSKIGMTIEESLQKSLPFSVKQFHSINYAKNDLDQRNIDMIVEIPENLTNEITVGNTAELKYYINQANASLSKQIMANAANNITQQVNKNIYTLRQKLTLSNLSNNINKSIPRTQTSNQLTDNITKAVQSLTTESIKSQITKTNNTEGFAATMLPLLIVLASWVGAMIMSLNLNFVSKKLNNLTTKWSLFWNRQLLNVAVSFLLAIITFLFLSIFHISIHSSILSVILFQSLVFFSFLSFTQLFVIVFGPGGMLFNVIALSVQLVTSGVIVPKLMLSHFYQSLGSLFPATYVAEGAYSVIFGGKALTHANFLLLIISIFTISLAVVRVTLSKQSKLDTVADNEIKSI